MGSPVTRASLKSYTDIFLELFPYYLSIGMTSHEYWEEDVDLAKAYRKADEMRRKRINEEAWLQGAYIYNAILCCAPVLHAFSKETKPQDYMKEPIPITPYEIKLKKEQEMLERANRFREFVNAKNEAIRRKKEAESKCQTKMAETP